MTSDNRFYETFYAIHVDDWGINFGTFSNHKKILTKEYINIGCSTTDYSSATDASEFIYPHHIKKVYFIEGVIEGQITIGSNSDEATVTSYKVTVCKMHENNATHDLFTTGWITVDDTLTWDGDYDIGEEQVYPFWIDAWKKEKLEEKERIYIRVETKCNNYAVLWHSNIATWEDIKIVIPFKL